jgi:hypothetical protein
MKSPDLSRMEEVLRKIGAKPKPAKIDPRSGKTGEDSYDILTPGQVRIIIEESQNGGTGVLERKSEQITLHILEPYFKDKESLEQIPALDPKFHVSPDCTTLEHMLNIGRYDRYVPSERHDGYFPVRPYDRVTDTRGEEMSAVLLPCMHCLREINYKGFNSKSPVGKKSVVEKFNIEEFFDEYKPIFRCRPLYTSDTLPHGGYTSDWADISSKHRALHDWTCSCCGVNCGETRGLLHVHHRDGNRGNNRPYNLIVLCLPCHKSQPLHGRMRYTLSEKTKLEQLRISQKLPRKCETCNL